MQPILFTIGYFRIFSLSLSIIIGWVIWSFLFWRRFRDNGIGEEETFNLMFWVTLWSFVCARAVFILFHPSQFIETPLKTVAIWVAPGLSFLGALVGAAIVSAIIIRKSKISFANVLDAFAQSLPFAWILGLVGSLLDGSYVGITTKLPWAIPYIGQAGRRHPVQLYMIAVLVLILLILTYVDRKFRISRYNVGLYGLIFLVVTSGTHLLIDFVTQRSYLIGPLSPGQWIAIAVISESLGVMYISYRGKEFISSCLKSVVSASIRSYRKIGTYGTATFSRFTKKVFWNRRNSNSKPELTNF